MTKIYCFLLPFFCFLPFSCKFNPNIQRKGVDYVQGTWEEDGVMYQDQLLQYTLHQFTFTCDSFYVIFNTFSKVNIYPDYCFNNGRWTEYAKGTYTSSHDTLFLTGTFTKPNFKQKISGCYRVGQYIETFKVKKHSSDTLYIQSLQQHTSIILSLKEKTVCRPKPLD